MNSKHFKSRKILSCNLCANKYVRPKNLANHYILVHRVYAESNEQVGESEADLSAPLEVLKLTQNKQITENGQSENLASNEILPHKVKHLFQCLKCNQFSDSCFRQLVEHNLSEHSESKPEFAIKCLACYRLFNTESFYNEHQCLLIGSLKTKFYECEFGCGKWYAGLSFLNRHHSKHWRKNNLVTKLQNKSETEISAPVASSKLQVLPLKPTIQKSIKIQIPKHHLFIHNLPKGTKASDLAELFNKLPLITSLIQLDLIRTKHNHDQLCGMLTFTDASLMRKIYGKFITLSKQIDFNGNTIRLSKQLPRSAKCNTNSKLRTLDSSEVTSSSSTSIPFDYLLLENSDSRRFISVASADHLEPGSIFLNQFNSKAASTDPLISVSVHLITETMTINFEPETSSADRSMLKTSVSNIPKYKLYVSGLNQQTKASDLKTYLSKHAQVEKVKIVEFYKTRGVYFGVAIFDNMSQMKKCLKSANQLHFNGNIISLTQKQPKLSI